jgi:hypothetical protein
MANQGDGFDRLGKRVEDRAERTAGNLADSKHPVLKVLGVIAILVVIGFGISVATGIIGFGAEALHETRRVLSVKNIREQQTAVIEDWQELLVASGNACNAVEAAGNANSPTFVEDPAMAYAAAVRKARIDYNRRQNNLFEAEKVGPGGYPRTIPYSKEMDSAKPDWCEISVKLHEVHE